MRNVSAVKAFDTAEGSAQAFAEEMSKELGVAITPAESAEEVVKGSDIVITMTIPIPPEVYFVDRLPVSLHATDVLVIVGVSILISFFATIYPALQASRLEPVDAIRHE